LLAAVLMLSSEERGIYVIFAGAGYACEVTVTSQHESLLGGPVCRRRRVCKAASLDKDVAWSGLLCVYFVRPRVC
jgi:hypothetical protein